MAFSRLHKPVVSRASSLFRARLFSSSRSFSRSYNAMYSIVRDSDTVPRPVFMPMLGRDHDKYLYNKPRIGVRYFSTSDSHQVLGMPALSPTMNQGNITTWRKKEGDKIEVGDVLCEIETDKATLEYESLEEGFLAKILVPGGSKDVPVGQPIAVMVEEEDDIKNVPASVAGGSEGKGEISEKTDVKSEESVQETSSTTIDTSDLPPHILLEMPALSPTMNQGNIAKWRKKEGDKIEVGDILCEIETDKATLEFESMEEGYLAKIIAPEGAKDILVGQPIAVTVEELADLETVKNAVMSGSSAKEDKPINHEVKHETGSQKGPVKRISPAAKILITEHRLDTSSIKASGSHGTLLKGDVLAAIKSGTGSLKASSSQQKSTPSPQNPQKPISADTKSPAKNLDSFEDFPNSQIRKVIAKRLLESKQNTPHLYLSSDVVLDPLLSLRKDLKEKHNVKVSVNDIVIKAVAVALRNVPEANAFWDVEKGEVVLCESVDISIAVATEKGLMTPIIRNADQKTLSAISAEVKELAEKARVGKLKPNEFQGGTFSISNLGMFPVDQFCAIINPPQAGILAVGRGNKVVGPVVGSDGVERAAAITKMNLTLSADHRVFDGKVGGAFLSALNSNFSDIRRLLL